LFFNAVWVLISGGFRIVSDTLIYLFFCQRQKAYQSVWAIKHWFYFSGHSTSWAN